MKKVILIILLCVSLMLGVTGCGSEDKYTNLIDIDKIYYHEIDNGKVSMYVVYSISSDSKQDFYVGQPAFVQTCYSLDNGGSTCEMRTLSPYYINTNDENRDLIEAANFPINEEYKTLKAGNNEKLKYVIQQTIDKEYIEDKDDTYLIVGLSTKLNTTNFIETTTVKKKFKFSEVETFKYKDNSEFVEEFQKDYNLNFE